ncbi:LON peptidase substrate-binding domain-containing protein [Inquilinus sp. CAU 1745]|uniref:LON peptidase substrate-binding domain-containing protein n=1 Tax=Inquilinus sp. CAU 1745 TaxID=3140369 RepID=UPI00325BD37C
MSQSPFFPTFDRLSPSIPIFPLAGVLLLPRGLLPLNIFEPRYIAMVDDALSSDRMIGMVQPTTPDSGAAAPEIYPLGCAGRITSFDETDDGRYLITLTGICRFHAGAELATTRGYRRVESDWSAFRDDMKGCDMEGGGCGLDRARLDAALGVYFRRHGISANWEAIKDTPDERLVTSLAMICPFDPPEKQALLEAPTPADRAELVVSLIEMAVLTPESGPEPGGESRH